MDRFAFDKRVQKTLADYGLPALAVTVLRQDAVLQQTAVGVRRLGEETPVTPQDVFHIGSCAKAMTATLIAMLVDAGELAWETTVLDVLPDWNGRIHPQFGSITIQQLLTHQAGLPPFEEEEEFLALPEFTGSNRQQRLDFSRYVLEMAPIHPPGAEFRYSNAGYCIATSLLESQAGRDWESLLRERIFQPLAMEAGFGWPAKADPAQPWGHVLGEDGRIHPHDPHDEYQLPPILAPAGDVYVRFDHYTAWMQMNLRGLRGEQTLISPEAMRHLHTKDGFAGLGWGVQTLLGQQVSAHTGSADTFFFLALLAPDADLGIVIATNAGFEYAEEGCVALLKELMPEFLA